MGTFQELKAVFFRAHARLVKAMGGKDALDGEVVSKFPLPLGNDAILEIQSYELCHLLPVQIMMLVR